VCTSWRERSGFLGPQGRCRVRREQIARSLVAMARRGCRRSQVAFPDVIGVRRGLSALQGLLGGLGAFGHQGGVPAESGF